ncbi:MAG: hypothetical protein AVDCRST_MAG91-3086, partial [uncultured Sphingomonadaceae bacterium]
VAECDRIVGEVGIGQDHRHARHLDRREEDVAPRVQPRLRDRAFLPMLRHHAARRAEGRPFDLACAGHAGALALRVRREPVVVQIM